MVFLRFMLVLEGLRSGRPVGRISSYFHVIWTPWCRVMTKYNNINDELGVLRFS